MEIILIDYILYKTQINYKNFNYDRIVDVYFFFLHLEVYVLDLSLKSNFV